MYLFLTIDLLFCITERRDYFLCTLYKNKKELKKFNKK